MGRRWLFVAVILTVASGCDNVSWGGVDMRLVAPPPPVAPLIPTQAQLEEELGLPPLPEGPILLAGTRDGDQAAFTVVGEVRGDAVAPLVTDAEAPGFMDHFTRNQLSPGTELILFAEGVRVGRMTVAESRMDDRFCSPRPTVTGTVEMVPGASGATRLLALRGDPTARPFGTYRVLSHDYDQRVASLALGTEGIRLAGVPFPSSLVDSRVDIQVFRLPEEGRASIAATFMDQDRLAVAPPREGAWALFVVGMQQGNTFQSGYLGFRPADAQGKGAPRFFSHLDLNGDGSSELVLEVFGRDTRWFTTLSRRVGTWVQTFQDPCGTPAG